MTTSFILFGSPVVSYVPIPKKRDLSYSRGLVKDRGQLETISKFGYSNSSLLSQDAYRSDIKDDSTPSRISELKRLLLLGWLSTQGSFKLMIRNTFLYQGCSWILISTKWRSTLWKHIHTIYTYLLNSVGMAEGG